METLKEILRIIEKNARATPQQLSLMTGIAAEEVENLIRKAEEERIIVRYKTIVNWEKLGEERVRALIDVKVQPQRDVGFDAVAERVSRFPQTHSVSLVSGVYDLSVLVVGKTMQEVAAFVSQKLAPLESVQGTVTHFLLKRYKEDGELLEGEEGARRLPLSF